MKTKPRQYGFSLLETLLAIGTLAIGMVFVAGTFLTGAYFTTVSSERTVAITAADEAFAKMRLYGLVDDPNLTTDACVPYEWIGEIPAGVLNAFAYPSLDDGTTGPYSWSALCRAVEEGSGRVQCTVFVSRRVSAAATYRAHVVNDLDSLESSAYPRPVRVAVAAGATGDPNDMVVIQDAGAYEFINDGAVVVDDRTGDIYRVLERLGDREDVIQLDRPWVQADGTEGAMWVVPRPETGGRDPLVAVYQSILKF